MFKIKIRVIFAVLCILSANKTYSQDYATNLDYIFLMHPVNARFEAMGRGNAASTGSPYSAFFNAASTSFSKGMNVEISHLEPNFYLEDKAVYNSYGISYNSEKYGAVAVNVLRFNSNREYSQWAWTGRKYDMKKFFPSLNYLTFNYSHILPHQMSFGFNANYLTIEDAKLKYQSVLFDAGLMKRFSDDGKNFISNYFLGVSITNISGAKAYYTEYVSLAEFNSVSRLIPSIFRIGGAMELFPYKKAGAFSLYKLLISLNYKNVLNSRYNTAIQIGSEITFLEMLKIRAGFYNEDFDRNHSPFNTDKVSKFTYGIGLNLPLDLFFNKYLPIQIQLDYTNPENPSIKKVIPEWAVNYNFHFYEYNYAIESNSPIYSLNIKIDF